MVPGLRNARTRSPSPQTVTHGSRGVVLEQGPSLVVIDHGDVLAIQIHLIGDASMMGGYDDGVLDPAELQGLWIYFIGLWSRKVELGGS